MNRMDLLKSALVAVALVAGGSAFAAWPYDKVDKVDIDPIETIVNGWQPAPFDGTKKILVFSECFGYNHHGGRCYGDYMFKRAGERYGAWTTVQETDAKKLGDKDYLAQFDALVFNNSTKICETNAPGVTEALLGYLESGKGIAIIHAGLDSFKDSERLQIAFGGFFKGHPWHDDGTWKFRNERPDHPLNAPFAYWGESFFKQEEIYQFPKHFDRSTCQVLVSVDVSDPVTKRAEMWWEKTFPGQTRPDHDYAVSWVKTVGKGRVFYTSFGHDRAAFLDQDRFYHMLLGLQYALGDVQ